MRTKWLEVTYQGKRKIIRVDTITDIHERQNGVKIYQGQQNILADESYNEIKKKMVYHEGQEPNTHEA